MVDKMFAFLKSLLFVIKKTNVGTKAHPGFGKSQVRLNQQLVHFGT